MNQIVVHAAAGLGKRRPMVHRQDYHSYFIVDMYTFTNYSGEQLVVTCFDASKEAYEELNYSWGSKL
jgi:hypothetical protein